MFRFNGPGRRSAWVAAVLLVTGVGARASTISPNTGSLGSAANGTNGDAVTLGPGALNAGGDQSAVYPGVTSSNTLVPHLAALNPASASPFSVEFWARPTASDNDDAPVSNRVASGDRSGWVFFQRAAATGWNFRMYNGAGSALGWDLTGGTANLNEWSHVVATWDGSAAQLFVNGQLADATNDPALNGVYNASGAANFIVASTDTGSPYTGSVDEVAFYGAALTPAQVLNHFTTATATPGAYQALVRTDGALLQLSNGAVPEPSALALVGAGAALLLRRRGPRRRA
jgi:hypothetical protein